MIIGVFCFSSSSLLRTSAAILAFAAPLLLWYLHVYYVPLFYDRQWSSDITSQDLVQ